MLPMGTIVTVCMFAVLLVASDLPLLRGLPQWLKRTVAVIALLGGLWNSLWHGLRHLTEFWGLAALVSGILMVICSLYVLRPGLLPAMLHRARPVILVVLLGYALMYAITIARL